MYREQTAQSDSRVNVTYEELASSKQMVDGSRMWSEGSLETSRWEWRLKEVNMSTSTFEVSTCVGLLALI